MAVKIEREALMQHATTQNKKQQAALALAALGVVYGDIGTSPLYTMKEVFGGIRGDLLAALCRVRPWVVPAAS